MTENVENLVLEHLRAIRADVGDIKERMNRVELRLSVMEQTLGSLYALAGSDRESLHGLTRRVERIERRLELVEHPH
jgi:archaellum component FlaC